MKRNGRIFLIVALLIGVTAVWVIQAQAYIYRYGDGCLVPYATYANGLDTAVELNISDFDPGDRIYWSFFSQNGDLLAQNVILLQASTFSYSFSLTTADANSRPGTIGYLVFTYDDNGTLYTTESRYPLYAIAVLLNLIADDAAFIPTVPLYRGDYENVDLDLTALDESSIEYLLNGFTSGATRSGLDVSYWIDPAFGASTKIIMWTTETPPAMIPATISTVAGDAIADVELHPSFSRLNVFDVATAVTGIPEGYVDGIITVGAGGGERYFFTLIRSSGFGAVQTFPAAERP